MMNLQEFIKESLLQIVRAVKEAQAEAEKLGAHVNPAGLSIPVDKITVPFHPSKNIYSTIIEFDVAVTAVEETTAKGGIGVSIGIIGAGGQGQKQTRNEDVSRLKFSIPVMLPTGQDLNPKTHSPTQNFAETGFDPRRR